MQKFIEKLIERLEERQNDIAGNLSLNVYYSDGYDKGIEYAIEIVNELADEYKDKSSIIDDLKAFLKEKFKYNSEQTEIWADDTDSYFRQQKDLYVDRANIYGEVMREIDRLSREYKVSEMPTGSEGFCEWEYDEYEDGWQTDCGTCFTLHDDDKEITNFCPYCGKKMKVLEL